MSGLMMALRRARWLILAIAVVVVVIAVVLPTELGGWAPVLHYACVQQQNPSETLYTWVPALMINSPYGGEAWGNGTVPPGPLSMSGLGTVMETGAANGSATWAGFRAQINITGEENQTQWGPGQSTRCAAPFSASARFWGGYVLGGPILGFGNASDSREPTSLGHWTFPGRRQSHDLERVCERQCTEHFDVWKGRLLKLHELQSV